MEETNTFISAGIKLHFEKQDTKKSVLLIFLAPYA
jgi:hypothetical protein